MRVWNTRKQEIASLTLPQVTGGTDPLTYALTPDLPEGLTFAQSGTPIKAMDETTYTLLLRLDARTGTGACPYG